MRKLFALFFFLTIVVIFFQSPLLHALLPIPSDTIVGLYNPYRDAFAKQYPRGIPYKNFLITDPVRQQYPWRSLTIELEKKLELPLWNPYNFSGTPLLANFQSAAFYPLNILLFIFPFWLGWSTLVALQPFLAGFFLYLYLQNFKLSKIASFLAGLVFAFSGFNIAWLEWNTLGQTLLWLPFILLCVECIIRSQRKYLWSILFIISLSCSLLAGHIQTFFYVYVFVQIYFLSRFIQIDRSKRTLALFIVSNILVLLITFIQWYPTLQFIALSGRNLDQINWQQEGWFIPFENLVQFIAPDFFGNPASLNYWGVWNYAEFVGYVGILPLIFVLFAVLFRKDKKTIFFSVIGILSLLLALPLPVSKLIYQFHLPFISTSQPTRLLSIVDFCLAVLTGLGFDYFMKQDRKKIFFPTFLLGIIFVILWILILPLHGKLFTQELANTLIAERNLIFPTILFGLTVVLLLVNIIISRKQKMTKNILYVSCVVLVLFDLFRFGQKFTPFTPISYLYPSTQTTQFLQKNIGNYRFMVLDNRILPPNFSSIYHLQSVEGYDPLYLQKYGEMIAVSERAEANIQPPFGFNRIITPHNYQSSVINLLGVKYILSLSDINHSSWKKVSQEGETRIYENKNVLPRVFFVKKIVFTSSKQSTLDIMFQKSFDPMQTAVTADSLLSNNALVKGSASIINYQPNKITIQTNSTGRGFLLLTDIFYPTWHAYIEKKETKIYLTDYSFRGILVPSGKHTIIFSDSLF